MWLFMVVFGVETSAMVVSTVGGTGDLFLVNMSQYESQGE